MLLFHRAFPLTISWSLTCIPWPGFLALASLEPSKCLVFVCGPESPPATMAFTLQPLNCTLPARGYGSILPTSLIYIILLTRGCTPWRPEAVMSTTRSANKSLLWVFKGRRERTGQCKRDTALPTITPFRRSIRFQGLTGLVK